MDQPARKDRSATILVRISGITFVLLGAAFLLIGYLAVTSHPVEAIHTGRGVVIGISIFVLGVAATFLRRWAVVLLSFLALAFSFFVAWGVVRGLPLPWSLLLAGSYIAVASIPAFSTYFAWRELR